MRLLEIESAGVKNCGEDEHQQHSANSDNAAEIKNAPGEPRNFCIGAKPEREISQSKQDTNFRGAKLSEGQSKDAKGVGREIAFDGEEQKGDEHSGGDAPIDIAGNGEAAHKEDGADRIDHVIDVEAVARALAIAEARDGAVEAVAEPIQREKNDGEGQTE